MLRDSAPALRPTREVPGQVMQIPDSHSGLYLDILIKSPDDLRACTYRWYYTNQGRDSLQTSWSAAVIGWCFDWPAFHFRSFRPAMICGFSVRCGLGMNRYNIIFSARWTSEEPAREMTDVLRSFACDGVRCSLFFSVSVPVTEISASRVCLQYPQSNTRSKWMSTQTENKDLILKQVKRVATYTRTNSRHH